MGNSERLEFAHGDTGLGTFVVNQRTRAAGNDNSRIRITAREFDGDDEACRPLLERDGAALERNLPAKSRRRA